MIHCKPRVQAGGVTVEMALLLPLLLLLTLPMIPVIRNILLQCALTNVSRELANEYARPTGLSPQEMMDVIARQALPRLTMAKNADLYLTKIVGQQNCLANGSQCTGVVTEQYQWTQGQRSEPSRVWACPGSQYQPGDGHCPITPTSNTADLLKNKLYQGQTIYVAEAFYHYTPLFGGLDFGFGLIPGFSSQLYSKTIF